MKKITFLTSFVALTFAVPAMAVPSNTSSTFPANGIMEEDYTYQNQATVTNLKVSEGTATTTANYANCPTAFPNSDEGAESTDECYTACTVSDFPANSHILTVTGKNYSGANVTDTCAIASCDTGYHLNPGAPNLTEIIGESAGTGNGYKSNSGRGTNYNESTYGITNNGEFVVDYGSSKGKIHGYARCSTQVGDNQSNTYTNPTTMSTLPDSSGQYCWCQLDGYTPNGGTMQSLSAPWVFSASWVPDGYGHGGPNTCADACAYTCGQLLFSDDNRRLNFRAAMFNAIPSGDPSCEANTIQITWADASAEDIAANDAGSVTYGGDIRTPKKAVHKPGKIFTGWTFTAQ